ncbi:MAG TPA: extracellular solute-binding protein [Limnochordia bacterium]|nr:extracellular solute-binding protein [Limnochordia bacterium]
MGCLVAGVASAQTTITLATYGSANAELKAWQQIGAAFTQSHPDVKVDVQVFAFGDYVDKIVAMSAAGAPPDIFQTWAQYKPNWADNGLIADISNLWKTSSVIADANIYPFMRDTTVYNGRYYGIPFDYNTEVWFLDADMLDGAGLDEPGAHWTVADLRQMGQKMSHPEQKIYGVADAANWGWGDNIQWMKNWSGHGWLNEDRTKVAVDDPKVTEMLQYWYDNTYGLNITPPAGVTAAKIGAQQGWLSYMFNYTANTPNYNWRLATFPAVPGGGQKDFAQGHMFSLAAHAAHSQAALTFLEWMASPAGQKAIVQYAQTEPITPAPELWNAFYNLLPADRVAYVRQWMTNVLYGQEAYADTFQYWNSFGKLNDIMIKHLNNIFVDKKAIGNELKQAAVEMQAAL